MTKEKKVEVKGASAVSAKLINGIMAEKFPGYNPNELPKITHISVNSGIGKFLIKEKEKGGLEFAMNVISRVTGQRPNKRLSRYSIANFGKLRKGQVVGLSTTLRGELMYSFLNKLILVAFPRTRDFRGASAKSFDKAGNYSVGIRDFKVFPESEFEGSLLKDFGFQVTIAFKSKSAEDSKILLQSINFPFKRS